LTAYHYLPSIKTDLLRRLDRPREAAFAYRLALEMAGNEAERHFLRMRLEQTTGS
jgi:RNA polymerase sigma-70 factor (ECF subfamily)